MAGLGHDGTFGDAGCGGRGGQTRPERMPAACQDTRAELTDPSYGNDFKNLIGYEYLFYAQYIHVPGAVFPLPNSMLT
jgi:hypothetical protein